MADEARAQLERILGSQTLGGSDQLKRLLRLIVERTLDGRPELLKEYNLGLEVFQRPPDYDPKIDPIVRVQARRLRSKLDEYYAGEGAHDPLVIHIPKGAYVPVFDIRKLALPPDRNPIGRRVWIFAGFAALAITVAIARLPRDHTAASANTNRSVAVLPLKMFSDNGSRGHIADQVTEVLTTELAKSRQLRVLSRTTASRYRETSASLPEIARVLQVRWVVEGGVGLEGSRAYVKLRAVDSLTDRKVWADVFDCEVSELVAVSARASIQIAATITAELESPER